MSVGPNTKLLANFKVGTTCLQCETIDVGLRGYEGPSRQNVAVVQRPAAGPASLCSGHSVPQRHTRWELHFQEPQLEVGHASG